MDRILTGLLLAALATATGAQEFEAPARYSYVLGTDVSLIGTSGHPSWVNGSAGKLRYDETNDDLAISHFFVDYKLRVLDTLDAVIVANVYNDDIGDSIDFTQAYLEWRPLTLSQSRVRMKLGGFYPRLSLENRGPAWTSPYMSSSSAINTWIGEEIRVFGAEFSASWRPMALGGAHALAVFASGYKNNDPAGGLIAWKGWSVHDRQSRFGDELPLPPLPQIQPDGLFWRQDPFFIPFQENDGDFGWYAGAEWQYQNRFLVRAMRYDNRADPMRVVDRQYAWYTEFNSLGLQADLPGGIGLIAQWLDGETVMGPIVGGAHVVDNAYASWFVLLTKVFGRHRVSVRYDDFAVTEKDRIPLDENAERGRAQAVAYRYQASDRVGVALEWLRIRSDRPAWEYNELATGRTEQQVQLSIQFRLSNR